MPRFVRAGAHSVNLDVVTRLTRHEPGPAVTVHFIGAEPVRLSGREAAEFLQAVAVAETRAAGHPGD